MSAHPPKTQAYAFTLTYRGGHRHVVILEMPANASRDDLRDRAEELCNTHEGSITWRKVKLLPERAARDQLILCGKRERAWGERRQYMQAMLTAYTRRRDAAAVAKSRRQRKQKGIA